MDINRTGPRRAHLDKPADATARTAGRFKSSASRPVDSPASAASSIVTHADLADATKTEEVAARSFGSLVDGAGRRIGVSLSGAQKRDLVEFLGKDPLIRGKLLSYLEQIAT